MPSRGPTFGSLPAVAFAPALKYDHNPGSEGEGLAAGAGGVGLGAKAGVVGLVAEAGGVGVVASTWLVEELPLTSGIDLLLGCIK